MGVRRHAEQAGWMRGNMRGMWWRGQRGVDGDASNKANRGAATRSQEWKLGRRSRRRDCRGSKEAASAIETLP